MSQKHSTSNTILKKKNKISISPFQKNQSNIYSTISHQQKIEDVGPCLLHSIQITQLCLSCSQFLCHQCIAGGIHRNHQIKSIDKCQTLIENRLQQYCIRLDSKSDILGLISDQLNYNCSQQYHEALICKQTIDQHFEKIFRLLNEKKKYLAENFEIEIEKYQQKSQKIKSQIKKSQQNFHKMSESIKQILQKKQNQLQFCNFYINTKDEINQLIDQQQIKKLKNQLSEIRWNVNAGQFQRINSQINNITLDYQIVHLGQNWSKNLNKQSKFSKKRLAKVYNLEKLGQTIAVIQSIQQSHPEYQTPKNWSREKKIKDEFKSKKNLFGGQLKKNKKNIHKMLSMPVSPDKETKDNNNFTVSFQKQTKYKKNMKKKQ